MYRLFLALPVLVAGCLKDETVSGHADPDNIYVLREIAGVSFPARATISFPEPGRVAGQAPCNGYSGAQTAPYPWIAFSDIQVTLLDCPDLPAEASFFQALSTMTLAEALGDVLILRNEAGDEMVFRAQD